MATEIKPFVAPPDSALWPSQKAIFRAMEAVAIRGADSFYWRRTGSSFGLVAVIYPHGIQHFSVLGFDNFPRSSIRV